MDLNKKVEEALNKQIGLEFEASMKYVGIGSYFTNEELPQLAKFFFKQSTEEREHAEKLIKYVLDRDGEVKIPAIPAMSSKFPSPHDAVMLALESEQRVTKAIYDLYDLSTAEKDHATSVMLHWFITEQVEEESTVRQLLKFVERGKESGMLTLEDYIAEIPPGGHEGD